MSSPAYNSAMGYAVDVLKAVKKSGYEMDYPLQQFVNVSVNIGASLSRAEIPTSQKEMQEAYKEANMNAYRSIYWSAILGQLEEYQRIPFDELRKKCEELQVMLDNGVKLMSHLTGNRLF